MAVCPTCNGKGEQYVPCPKCGGSRPACLTCKGKRIVKVACWDCKGRKTGMKVIETETSLALDRLNWARSYAACPYFNGYGTCNMGCRTEPTCRTDAPDDDGGWDSEIRDAYADLEDAARWDAWDSRGRHGMVKHYRDVARWAAKNVVPR